MKRNFVFFPCTLLIMISISVLVLAQVAHAYETGCGNDGDNAPNNCDCTNNSGGDCPSSDTDEETCGDGNNPVQVHKANLHRQVEDITTFGAAPIAFRRSLNSRTSDFNDAYWELGYRQTWQHNWNFEVRQLSTKTYGFFDIKVRYADGNDQNFKATDSTGAQLAAPAHNGDRLYRWAGATVGYTLLMSSGEELDFKRTLSPKFQLTQVRNGLGFAWTCSYDTTARLIKVTNNFGRWIQIDRETGTDGVVRISRVSTSDGRAVYYGYSGWAASGRHVLSSVTYPGNELASYTYVTSNPNDLAARPVLASALDPTYKRGAGGAQMKYVYNYNVFSVGSLITGSVLEERSAATDQKIVALPLGSGNYPQVLEGDGTEVTRQFSNGLLTVKADGEGRTTTYNRDSGGAGYVTSRTDPDGGVTSFTRDYAGRVLSQTDALGHSRNFGYNPKGLLVTRTDELSRATTITRDTVNGRPVRIDYPDASYEEWTYNANSQPLTHRRRNGGTESFAYDSLGNRTSHTNALGYTKTYAYHPNGLVSSVTDAKSATTSFTYDWRGNRLTITHADNTTVAFTYDFFGNRTSITDELGNIKSFSYDEYNRLTSVTDALNRTTIYEYGLTPDCSSCSYADVVSRIISPGGHKTEYQYDRSRLRTSVTVGAGTPDAATTSYSYDAGRNLTTVTDPRGKTWRFTYDSRNRQTSATDPIGNQTQWTYDDRGNKLTETQPGGGMTRLVYDSRNRVTEKSDALNQVTRMSYDAAGNLVALTDSRNNMYSYTYDLLNHKTSVTYPNGTTETYGYDPAGNVQTFTTRSGQSKTSTYDIRNREIQTNWSDNTLGVTTTYDSTGRVLTMNNNASALAFSYDAAGQVTSETQTIAGGAGPKTIGYLYDADGNRTSMTGPDFDSLAYTYTGRGQLSSIRFGSGAPNAPATVRYIYDAKGNRLSRTLENNTATHYSYDNASNVISLDQQKYAVSFARLDYTYDAHGNRTTRTEVDAGASPVRDVYNHDAIDQLTEVKYDFDAGNNTQERLVRYTHDSTGNRSRVTDNTETIDYAANALNQYSTIDGSAAPAYDNNGNLSQYSGMTYTYDALNRMTAASNGSGTTISFSYDARNRCVSRSINGSIVFLYYDGRNLIQENDPSDVFQARYVHGGVKDEMVMKLGADGSRVYFHQDVIGSTVALTNGSGNITEKYSYDVYGAPTFRDATGAPVASSASKNRFLFTGREYLQEIGLYNYRRRSYSPSLGRFLQPDSIRFRGRDSNLYRYARNNPARWRDSSGKQLELAPPDPTPFEPSVDIVPYDYALPEFNPDDPFPHEPLFPDPFPTPAPEPPPPSDPGTPPPYEPPDVEWFGLWDCEVIPSTCCDYDCYLDHCYSGDCPETLPYHLDPDENGGCLESTSYGTNSAGFAL